MLLLPKDQLKQEAAKLVVDIQQVAWENTHEINKKRLATIRQKKKMATDKSTQR